MTKNKKDNSITGYVEIEKIGKRIFMLNGALELDNIDKDKEVKIKNSILSLFTPKEKKSITLYKERSFINEKLRESVKESLEKAFEYAISIGQVDKKHKLAYMTVKAINIIIKETSSVLFVMSNYDKEQKDTIYVDNMKIIREIKYSAIEMKDAFKKQLIEVYENIREIQTFPNGDIEKLFLTKPEDDMIKMLKRGWKTIPMKDIPILHSIQEKIAAHKELESSEE